MKTEEVYVYSEEYGDELVMLRLSTAQKLAQEGRSFITLEELARSYSRSLGWTSSRV